MANPTKAPKATPTPAPKATLATPAPTTPAPTTPAPLAPTAIATAAVATLPTTNGKPVGATKGTGASLANLCAWLATNPPVGGGRTTIPHPSTVAGMLLALLATGPATLHQCSMAVANATTTNGPHPLASMCRRLHTLWGYTLVYNAYAGTLACVGYPPVAAHPAYRCPHRPVAAPGAGPAPVAVAVAPKAVAPKG